MVNTITTQISHASMNHELTQSENLVASNDDLLTDILLRLPVISILRFKSVSKHWHLLLTHPHFTNRYSNPPKSPGLFFGNSYVPFDATNPSPPPPFCSDIKILQSCNGLLLCSIRNGSDKYYVFNPTTKQVATIPPVPGGPKVCKSICLMALAFHQTCCVHYKVVCVRSLEDGVWGLFQIQIYSSDTRKWKISIQSFSAPIRLISPGVYWNGAVYWVPFWDNRECLYFKIDVDRVETLPLPVGLMCSGIITMHIGESRGHLHLVAYKNRQENGLRVNVNVYEMLSDCSGWFLKYQLQLDKICASFPEMISWYIYDFKVIDVIRSEEKEEEENMLLVLMISKKIITYNVRDKSFKQIFSLPSGYVVDQSSFHRYTETLTSL